MSSPASKDARLVSKFSAHAWLILLLIAIALFWTATSRRIDRVSRLTEQPTWSVASPERNDTSPTGFAKGQRHLIVPGHHAASYAWITESQIAAAQGLLRLHHIDYDSAPDGRAINRTAPYRCWLISVGWLYATFNNEPLGFAIEQGTLFADPLLLGLLLVIGTLYTARYLGSFAAVGFTIGAISLFPFSANFQPGAPDPHSLSWVLAVASVLPIFGAAISPKANSRLHFIVAGICGGLGVWNDSISQLPVLFAILLGAIGYELIRSRDSAATPTPSHWLAWAIAGAATTLAASIIEYPFDATSWNLDSIHPLHSVLWLGIGGVLFVTGQFAQKGKASLNGKALSVLALSILAVAAWPIAAAATGSGGLLASDFTARQLANHPRAGLAPNLGEWLNRADGFGVKWATVTPAILFFLFLAQLFMAKTDSKSRALLAFALLVSLVAMVLASLQIRLWNLVDALTLAVLAVFFATANKSQGNERWWALAATLIAVPGLFVGFPDRVSGDITDQLTDLEAQSLVERDFAYWLNKRSGEEPITLFSTPIFSGAAAYYGGFKTIVSGDDGNETGLQTAIRIASANTEQEVSLLLNSRGITHLALPPWDPTLIQLVRIGLKVPPSQQLPPDALAVALLDWDVPPWMRPLNYHLPNQEKLREYPIQAFAKHVKQEPELALSRLADLLVEQGQAPQILQSLRKALESYPRSVEAIAATANIDRALGDQAKLTETLATLKPYLSRRASRNLPADRRISIAALFMQAKQTDTAKDQLGKALGSLTQDDLKLMTPNAVALALALSGNLEVPFPDPGLEQLALELVPPNLQERLARKQ